MIAPPPPFAFNAPVFNLYTSNLSGIEAWTRANMGARPASACRCAHGYFKIVLESALAVRGRVM